MPLCGGSPSDNGSSLDVFRPAEAIRENARRLGMSPYNLRRMLKSIGNRLRNGAPPLFISG